MRSVVFGVSWVVLLAACDGTMNSRGRPRGEDAGVANPLVDAHFEPFDAGPPGMPGCFPNPTDDLDSDGFTPAEGDCFDCSPQVNPGAFDDPGNDVDEDCDGTAATAFEFCDTGLALDARDPNDAARAIGLCRFTSESSPGWGVISARWTRADGTGVPRSDLQHGVMSNFGSIGARSGNAMLALSSGVARSMSQPSYTDDCDLFNNGFDDDGGWPAGLDPDSPACPGVRSGPVLDPIALEVRVRVPSNAQGFRFESSFFTYEYPNFICSEYNDFFVVLMEPRPMGSPDGNLVFDTDGNKVSVNNSLLRACSPGSFGGRHFDCPLGMGPLRDTSYGDEALCGTSGFGDFFPGLEKDPIGAGTGWLRTQTPVEGGSIVTLRFAIWDAGDPTLDSLALIDSAEWLLEDPGVVTTDPILF